MSSNKICGEASSEFTTRKISRIATIFKFISSYLETIKNEKSKKNNPNIMSEYPVKRIGFPESLTNTQAKDNEKFPQIINKLAR